MPSLIDRIRLRLFSWIGKDWRVQALVVFLILAGYFYSLSTSHPFIISGDGIGYFENFQTGTPSALYRSGYPYFFRPFLFGTSNESVLANRLLIANIAFASVVGTILFCAIRRIFPASIAFLAAAFAILNPHFTTQVFTSRPEWLVCSLSVLLFALAVWAVKAVCGASGLAWFCCL
jgi:hypothetical protein